MKKTIGTAVLATALLATTAAPARAAEPVNTTGQLPDGAAYSVAVPADWNGDLVIAAGRPNLTGGYVDWLKEQGYGIIGYDLSDGWNLPADVANATEALAAFTRTVSTPQDVILTGRSQGGLVTRLVTGTSPGWLDGALPMCGGGAGAISMWNAKLDTAFALKTLVDPAAPLAITGLTDPRAEARALQDLTSKALATPADRARLVLAAALSKIPALEQSTGEPVADLDGRIAAYAAALPLAVGSGVRAGFEQTVGGRFSWNDGVDYRQELLASGRYEEVKAAYRAAGADLDADLATLAAAPRLSADKDAVAVVERIGTFTGELDVPVLSLHTTGDPAGPAADDAAYASVVRAAGDNAELRQTFVKAAGHCTFTDAEQAAATQVLINRVREDRWDPANPVRLNRQAAALEEASAVVLGTSRFTGPEPAQPARPWDVRQWGTY